MRGIIPFRLLMTSSLIAQTRDPTRLTREVTPTFQSIHLNVDARKPDFSGSTRIDLTVHKSVTAFRLHARDMKFDKLTLTGSKGAIPVTHEVTKEKGIVTLTASAPI